MRGYNTKRGRNSAASGVRARIDKNGRHDWIRTSDLFRVKSPDGLIRRNRKRHEAARKGSVHAGFTRVRCLLCLTGRHCRRQPDMGRDVRVMTRAVTQGQWTPVGLPPPNGRAPVCTRGCGDCCGPTATQDIGGIWSWQPFYNIFTTLSSRAALCISRDRVRRNGHGGVVPEWRQGCAGRRNQSGRWRGVKGKVSKRSLRNRTNPGPLVPAKAPPSRSGTLALEQMQKDRELGNRQYIGSRPAGEMEIPDSLLNSSPLACTTGFALGMPSSRHYTIARGGYIVFSFWADGSAAQITWAASGTC